jgi:hypothetical protein
MPTHKKYTLASRTSYAKPKLAREYFFSYPRRIFPNSSFFKNLFSQRMGLVHNRTDIASIVNRIGQSVSKLSTTALRRDRRASGNSRFAKAGVSCFYDSDVLNSSFVHLMKFSAKNPCLRKAAKRYHQC